MAFTHLDENGAARMVDISGKKKARRQARAAGTVFLSPETMEAIKQNLVKKGDVLAIARVAAINGAKKTSELIPLCHPIPVDTIGVDFDLKEDRIVISAFAACEYKTGIEMEALTAVSIAALTIYDMCKALDRNIKISGIELVEKTKNEI